MIDLHCDTMMQLLDHPDSGDLYRNTWKIDIEKLQKAHSKIQDFALFINMGETNDPYGRYEEMRNLCVSQIHNYGEHIQHVLSYQDVESVYKSGKIGALMSIEEGGVLGGDLNKLKQAYQDGVRLITLTWNYPNGLGEPHCGEQHKKLTSKGVEFVEMNDCDNCCGFGGSYSLLYPEISAPILEKKIQNIKESGADVVALDCPGCLMQIKGGLDARGIDDIKVKHTAEIIAEKRGLI